MLGRVGLSLGKIRFFRTEVGVVVGFRLNY